MHDEVDRRMDALLVDHWEVCTDLGSGSKNFHQSMAERESYLQSMGMVADLENNMFHLEVDIGEWVVLLSC